MRELVYIIRAARPMLSIYTTIFHITALLYCSKIIIILSERTTDAFSGGNFEFIFRSTAGNSSYVKKSSPAARIYKCKPIA